MCMHRSHSPNCIAKVLLAFLPSREVIGAKMARPVEQQEEAAALESIYENSIHIWNQDDPTEPMYMDIALSPQNMVRIHLPIDYPFAASPTLEFVNTTYTDQDKRTMSERMVRFMSSF